MSEKRRRVFDSMRGFNELFAGTTLAAKTLIERCAADGHADLTELADQFTNRAVAGPLVAIGLIAITDNVATLTESGEAFVAARREARKRRPHDRTT